MTECDGWTRTEPQNHSGFCPAAGFGGIYALVGVLLFLVTASPALADGSVPLADGSVPLADGSVPL
ncbi:MAG: hypothetical protein O2931_14010, partial [Planctomycetota bacterium]|nr:hypothetical protein [Planctomycetota bacterium]